jgi:uncharacterized protein (DUF2236 family)
MLHRNKGQIYFFIWVSILLISSCSLRYTTPRTGEEFSREISRLEKLTQEAPDSPAKAKLHLQLARLYTDYRNPQRDYPKGRKEFAAYLSLVPEGRKNDEIQNWVSVLEELEKSEKEAAGLKAKMESLTGENTETKETLILQLKKNQELQSRLESLEKTNRSLTEANRSLKEMIEQLKKLDLQMEERRKTIR